MLAAVMLSRQKLKLATARLSTFGLIPEQGNTSLGHWERHFHL